MKKKVLFFSLFCFIAGILSAQNLVKNPGFEEMYECPESHNSENKSYRLVPGWTYPTHAASDYFNRCGKMDAGVPKNFAGESEPSDGDGYVGAILSGTSESRREYIQGELKVPMQQGEKYCITYHFKLASGSQFAVDQISLFLSNTQVKGEGVEALNLKPQYNNLDGLFIDNVNKWQRACYVHTALGGEKFFIIGNFKDYMNTNYVITDKSIVNERNKKYAYYYFDDVSVQLLKDCNDCPCVQHDFEAAVKDTFYTGGVDPITGRVDKIINDGKISLTILGGTPPYDISWSDGRKGLTLTNLPAGKYTYVAKDNYNCKATGTVHFIEPEITVDDFEDGLQNIEEGAAIVLENIFFEFNKYTLLPTSYTELDKVVEFLKENQIQKIEISGHTDADGSAAYNQKLSEGRAKSVVQYLVDKGISPTRLVAVGYGKSKPIDTNQSDDGKAVNRRVEFRILKK